MILEAITAIGKAIAESMGFANKRTDLKNQSDVKAAKSSQDEQDEVAKDVNATSSNDLEEMRKRASE